MRNFDFDRDPLRLELLPEGWDREPMSFSYRSTARREAGGNPYTLQIVTTTAVVSFFGLIALRTFAHLVPFVPVIYSWQIIGLVFLFGLSGSIPSFLRGEPPSVWLAQLLFPFVVYLSFAYITQPTRQLWPVVFVVTLMLADALAGNYIAWMAADARVDFDTRALLKARWKGRFGKESWFSAMMGLFGGRMSPRVLDLYPARLLMLSAGFLVVLAMLGRYRDFSGGMLAVFALLGWFVAVGAFLPRLTGQRPIRLRRQFRVVARAVENWFNYNPRDRVAPGLHQSPFGAAVRRLALAVAALAAIGAAVNLTAAYFPVTIFGQYGAMPWAWNLAEIGNKPYRDGIAKKFADQVSEPRRHEGIESLNFEEKLVHQQLPEEKRAAYLRSVVERREAVRARIVVKDDHYRRVLEVPEGWLLPNLIGVFKGQGFFIWSFLLSFLLGVTVPPLFLFLASWALCGYDLAMLEYRFGHGRWREHAREPGEEPKESPGWYNREWLGYVDSIHNSTNPVERESVFLGFAQDFLTDDQFPVLMHREMLSEHAHITGDSGSGKTSRGVSAMAAQLARFSGERKDCSIVVIDLKGDDALFHGLRHEAEVHGLPFRWYRDQVGYTSYAFNPLMQSHVDYFNPAQRARMVMDAFGLRQGDDFGARYFADVQESVVRRVFEKDGEKIRSLADMHKLLQARNARAKYCPDMPERDWDHGFHVREQLGAFAGCEPLNDLTEDPARRIDMPSVFVEPQIAYFWVPSLLGGGANQQAAKFALYSLLTAALVLPPERRSQVYCFIDEFQEIVGANIGVLLRQARSFDIGLVLSNQTPYDLNRGNVMLTTTLSGAIGFRWSFRAGHTLHQKEIQDASGEYVRWMRSEGMGVQVDAQGNRSKTMNIGRTESFRPHLEKNQLLYANFVDDLSIAHFSQGQEYTQFFRPFPLRTMFHVHKDLHKKRGREAWPLLPFPPGPSPRVGKAGVEGSEHPEEGEAIESGATRPLPPPFKP